MPETAGVAGTKPGPRSTTGVSHAGGRDCYWSYHHCLSGLLAGSWNQELQLETKPRNLNVRHRCLNCYAKRYTNRQPQELLIFNRYFTTIISMLSVECMNQVSVMSMALWTIQTRIPLRPCPQKLTESGKERQTLKSDDFKRS